MSSLHIYDNINRNYYVLKEKVLLCIGQLSVAVLQGTTIAIQLRELGLSRDKLTIIDPYATLCEQFNDFFSSYKAFWLYITSP